MADFEPLDAHMAATVAAGACIRISGLRKVFATAGGQKVAVEALSLDMVAGQVFVLLGRNGAGKSTTVSMLTGTLQPTSGCVTAFGQEAAALVPVVTTEVSEVGLTSVLNKTVCLQT